MNLIEKINLVKKSIVAIGIKTTPTEFKILGSGFFIDSEKGNILSVAHLFANLNDGQTKNLVAMVAEKEENNLLHYKVLPLEIIDKDIIEDSALLKIEDISNTLLTALELGDETSVSEGQDVYFSGFPYALELINSGFGITQITNRGMISSVKRKSVSPQQLDWFIVDAVSNPGNSGCPLFDCETNKVIGIMSITFNAKTKIQDIVINQPMHIAGAKPISYAKGLLT